MAEPGATPAASCASIMPAYCDANSSYVFFVIGAARIQSRRHDSPCPALEDCSVASVPLDCMRDAHEFFRVGEDAYCLNLALLRLDGQHDERLIVNKDNQGDLSIDFFGLDARALRPEAPRSQHKARNGVAPGDGTCGRALRLAAAVGPERHVFGEQLHQRLQVAALRRAQESGEQLAVGVG